MIRICSNVVCFLLCSFSHVVNEELIFRNAPLSMEVTVNMNDMNDMKAC